MAKPNPTAGVIAQMKPGDHVVIETNAAQEVITALATQAIHGSGRARTGHDTAVTRRLPNGNLELWWAPSD